MEAAGMPTITSLQPPSASAAITGCTGDSGSTASIVTTTSAASSPSSTNGTNSSTSSGSGSKSGVVAFHLDVFNLVVLAALTVLAIVAIVLLVIQRRRKHRLLQQRLAQRAAEAALQSASADVEAGGGSGGASAEEITKRLGPALRWAEEELGSGAEGGIDGDEPPAPPRGAAKWFLRKSEDELCCAVCLGEVLRGEWVRKLPACGHVFHQECVEAWLLSKAWCPLCRTELFPQETNKAVLKQGSEGGAESVAIPIPPGAPSPEEEEELVGNAATQGGSVVEGTGTLRNEGIQRANSEDQVSSGGSTSTSISVLQSQTTALPLRQDG